MTKQAEFINRLQTALTEEGLARLRALEAEFGSTLTRFPVMAQEMKTMIEAGDDVDYDELVPRVETQLNQAAELSARLEMLTKEEQSVPTMTDFLNLLRSKITLHSVKVWEQEFDQQITAARQWLKEEDERIRKEKEAAERKKKENEARIRREQEEAKRKEEDRKEEERKAREAERRRIEEENARKVVTDFDGNPINFSSAPDEVIKVTGRIVAYECITSPFRAQIAQFISSIIFSAFISLFICGLIFQNFISFIISFVIFETILFGMMPSCESYYIGEDGIYHIQSYKYQFISFIGDGIKYAYIDSIAFSRISIIKYIEMTNGNKFVRIYHKKCLIFLMNHNILPEEFKYFIESNLSKF